MTFSRCAGLSECCFSNGDFFFERTVDVSMSKTVTVGTLVRLNSERSGLRASVVPACKVELEPVVCSISSLQNIAIAFKKGFKIFSCQSFYFKPQPLPVWVPWLSSAFSVIGSSLNVLATSHLYVCNSNNFFYTFMLSKEFFYNYIFNFGNIAEINRFLNLFIICLNVC